MKRDDREETVLDMARKLQAYADAMHDPTHARIAALETHLQKLEDKIEENPNTLREEMKEGFLQILAVEIRGSGRKHRRPSDKERRYTPRAELWSFLHDCGENMRRWDGKSTAALVQRVLELEDSKTQRGSSTKKEAAPVTQGMKDNQAQRGPASSQGVKWAFRIVAVETEGVKQLNTLPGLSENPSAVGFLKGEEQRVPIATSTVHHQQYRTTRDAVIPIHKMIQCRPQFAFTWRGVQYTWNQLPQGWKHSPTICHGLIQTALEKGEGPEHLQYIDDIIVWGNTAAEVFEKGEKIIQILQKASFTIKKSKVKGPA
ncbi:hypothetical protein HGM15179_019558 [Zosterops borbonicus]|uniref:ribonuclease H n=1 Tax=Zosterops borbonicus TaxID=364589 RepID=A0A8K1DBH0_9PASS|nr:hypothetical protein HGM15179_019558 [Zosterops borbonicus]